MPSVMITDKMLDPPNQKKGFFFVKIISNIYHFSFKFWLPFVQNTPLKFVHLKCNMILDLTNNVKLMVCTSKLWI